jgi:hypothetical protein
MQDLASSTSGMNPEVEDDRGRHGNQGYPSLAMATRDIHPWLHGDPDQREAAR